MKKEIDPIISKESNKQQLLNYVKESDKRMNDELSNISTKNDKDLVKKTRKEAEEKPALEKEILTKQYHLMIKRLWYIITWPSPVLATVFAVWLLILQPSWL